MARFWIREDGFGVEFGEEIEGVKNPEDSTSVADLASAEKVAVTALERVEESFLNFIEESEREEEREEEREDEEKIKILT